MSVAKLIDDYMAGPQILRKAVAGMTKEQLKAKPIPGKWSALEVVCHLADFEPVYADRMKRVIAEEKPSLVGANQDLFAQRLAYDQRDAEEELAIVENTRRQMARIFKTLKPEDFNRIGVHTEYGERTLEKLLSTITNHIPHHAKFIDEKRKALGL